MRNRIRITLTALALVLAVNGLQAQTAKVEYAYDGMYQFIPKSMTADGKVRLVTRAQMAAMARRKFTSPCTTRTLSKKKSYRTMQE